MSVLVYTENWDGKFKKSTFELVSFAKKISESIGGEVIAVSFGDIGSEESQQLGKYGAGKLILIKDSKYKGLDNQVYTRVLAEIATQEGANVMLFANNNSGKALAPRVAVRLKAGLATGLVRLPVSYDPFMVYKKVFSGKAFANQIITTQNRVLTLAQNSFELIENPVNISVVDYAPTTDLQPKTKIIDTHKQSGQVILTDAEIVVSGGRGMRSGDNWAPLVELAEILGAATACSRPVSDEGWRPHSEHTGQTGKIIAPNLYFAFGISGAIQHLAGISSSKCIVAVNTDPDAPIFEAANYGIVGDALKVLPELVEEVRKVR